MADTLFHVYFLKKFNNYFNRKVIGFETLNEYLEAVEEYFTPNNAISFNPTDNVSTELIMNDCPFEADYCLITDLEGSIVSRWFVMESVFTRKGQYSHQLRRDVIYDNLDNLYSSPVFVQKGYLKDSDPFIFNSEGMSFNEIKKDETLLKDDTGASYIVGYIAKNASASEVSIQVGLETLPDSISLETIAADLDVSISVLNDLINYNNATNNPAYFAEEVKIRYGWSSSDPIPFVVKDNFIFKTDFSSGQAYGGELVASYPNTLCKMKSLMIAVGAPQKEKAFKDALIAGIVANKASAVASMPSIFGRPYLTNEHLEKLQKYLGKIIKYNDKYYKLQLNINGVNEEVQGPAVYTSFGGIGTGISAGASTTQFTDAATFHPDGAISVILRGTLAYLSLNDETIDSAIPSITTKIPTTRNANANNNYDLFVIPYSSAQVDNITTLPNIAQRVASAIAQELDKACYDVQLLPYFPWPDIVKNGVIDLTNLTEDVDYSIIYNDFNNYVITRSVNGEEMTPMPTSPPYTYRNEYLIFEDAVGTVNGSVSVNIISGGSYIIDTSAGIYQDGTNVYITSDVRMTLEGTQNLDKIVIQLVATLTSGKYKASYIFFPKSDSFRTLIKQSLSLKDSVKVESECNKYRLCSPNYQGSFDFNVAKNGGTVDYFIAECTYKPYTPYIKVVPQFNLLYGTNFSDARGLLCGGDFSLSRFTDAWESFELQNKNYQNIFNREIQHLDFEQSLEYRKAVITGGLGVLTGGAAGAAGGAMATGHWAGAIVGGVGGLAGSAAGMTLDLDMLGKQQREAKQYSIDKFNYELGNIKALPYTLTKIGAFNINSKVWPFLEYYTCTDEEKTALENKLKYESMTVMRIGSFGDFWRVDPEQLRYFKGDLIRNDDIAEDNHVFEAIYTEIAKGVYM